MQFVCAKRLRPLLTSLGLALFVAALSQAGSAQEMLWQTLFDSGVDAQNKGDLRQSQRQLTGALKDAETFAARDPRLPRTLRAVALVEDELGNWTNAAEYLTRAISLEDKVSGLSKQEQQYNASVDSARLAAVYMHAGRYAEAEPLFKRAIDTLEKLAPTENTRTVSPSPASELAVGLSNWAALYESEGKFVEAEPLLKKALLIAEQSAAQNPSALGSSLDNLGKLYCLQSRFAEAEPLLKRALTVRVQGLGPINADVAKSLLSLGSLYQQQAKYIEAEAVLKRAVAVIEQAHGADTADYANALISYAKLLREQYKLDAALRQYELALSVQEKALGSSSPLVADTLSDLAQVRLEAYDYAGAAPLLQRALTIHESVYGKDSPMIARDLNALALLHLDQGQYDIAEEFYKRALKVVESKMPSDHPDVASCLNNLAFLYKNEAKYSEAESLLKRGLAIREKAFSANDRRVGQNLVNLADVYGAQENFALAEPLLKRALAIEQSALGADHPQVASVMNDLAEVYLEERKLAESETLYRKLLDRDQRLLGAENPAVASDMDKLSQILKTLGQESQSEDFHRRALAIKSRLPGAQFAAWTGGNFFPAAKHAPPVKNKWALVIGISNFKDPKINLQYAAKDATDLRNYLVSEAHFAADHVQLLTDKQATRENIVAMLGDKWLKRVAQPDDLVLLYVSTHGTASKREVGDTNFIVPYEANVDNIVLSGIPMQWLTVGLKEMLHCNRLIVIMDVCHSGAAAGDASASNNESHLNHPQVAYAGTSEGSKSIASGVTSFNAPDHSNTLDVDDRNRRPGEKGLRRVPPNFRVDKVEMGTGQIVLTSSASDQVSWESKSYPNSVFTRQLIEGLRLKGDQTTLGDAYEQMRKRVEEEVLRDRAAIQTPVLMTQSWGQDDVRLSIIPESEAGTTATPSPSVGVKNKKAGDSTAQQAASPNASRGALPTVRPESNRKVPSKYRGK
jgi:tetratricopeptide (TPR) repeat protein